MDSTREQPACRAFERLLRERGLPRRFVPTMAFASLPPTDYQPIELSVWWSRLGISIERIRSGHPQQDGRHERMHLTLKNETTRPAGANLLQQQAKSMPLSRSSTAKGRMKLLPCSVQAGFTLPQPGPITAFPIPITHFTTRLSWSPTAAASAFIARKSISAPARPPSCRYQRGIVSKRYRKASGSSAL